MGYPVLASFEEHVEERGEEALVKLEKRNYKHAQASVFQNKSIKLTPRWKLC